MKLTIRETHIHVVGIAACVINDNDIVIVWVVYFTIPRTTTNKNSHHGFAPHCVVLASYSRPHE